MTTNKFIAIIDFGSQYTHLISRRLKDLSVAYKIFPPTVSSNQLTKAQGLILSGGPNSVITNPIKYNDQIFKLNLPILGLCYGHQLISQIFGGQITPSKIREYGLAKLVIKKNNLLLKDLPKVSVVWMSHGDSVTKLPKDFTTLASTTSLKQAAIVHKTKPIFGLQFHPEVHHTAYGLDILTRFVFDICKTKTNQQTSLVQEILQETIKQAKNKKVFLLASGGIDSTVALAIMSKALGNNRVQALHVDTGFMRQNESLLVKRALNKIGFNNLHIIQAKNLFLNKLKKISEPETKRQIIGQTFLQCVNLGIKNLKLNKKDWLLGQGTIYPDTIESGGTKHADKIKTHHNRIGLLADLAAKGLLVEPLRKLYKDEVRQLGNDLKLPPELIWTHPFPGPGLAVRILCLNKKELKNSAVNNFQLTKLKLKHRLLPIKSVGVQGDERSYAHPLALEGTYKNFINYTKQATKLANQHPEINRVILKIFGPTINLGQPYEAYLSANRIKKLQILDHLISKILKQANVYYKIWQCPVILIPFGQQYKDSLVLRPFASKEAMTGQAYRLPAKTLSQIVKQIKKLKLVDYIFYDLTNKPPGTIEWE
ncbi:glutamine-hydrolyzing GMP synthase [Patescibacteria group bacterium]|nr:glutamine-hydrolyzing GMP synthase [Patescibacteria group bacterium]